MGRGKRTGTTLTEGPGRHRRLPDVLRPPEPLELRLLLGWSYERDEETGRSALPEVGDSGTVSIERVEEDEMVRLYIAGERPYMTYPAERLWDLRDLLRATAPTRCAVTRVDKDRGEIVVAVAREA